MPARPCWSVMPSAISWHACSRSTIRGWCAAANEAQRQANLATKQSEWWAAGGVPLLDLQAQHDPFKPPESRNELKEEFGDRVTIVTIPNASHALIPEQPQAVTDAIVAWVRR